MLFVEIHAQTAATHHAVPIGAAGRPRGRVDTKDFASYYTLWSGQIESYTGTLRVHNWRRELVVWGGMGTSVSLAEPALHNRPGGRKAQSPDSDIRSSQRMPMSISWAVGPDAVSHAVPTVAQWVPRRPAELLAAGRLPCS